MDKRIEFLEELRDFLKKYNTKIEIDQEFDRYTDEPSCYASINITGMFGEDIVFDEVDIDEESIEKQLEVL